MRDFRNPRYKVLRDREECIECDLCVRQCANEVHYRDEKTGALRADSMKCVNCQRCTLLCPTRALAITRWPQVDAGSAVWTEGAMDDITAQAQTGGVLLASMGNPKSYHIYWEHLLLNASQVTNPSIDPLREPMETRVVLGSRPSKLRVNERTRTVVSPLPPQLSLDVPIMFSAMRCRLTLRRRSRWPRASWAPTSTAARAACTAIWNPTPTAPSYRWQADASAWTRIT